MITVIIADNHPATREGIRLHLTKSSEITLVGEASNGAQAFLLCQEHQPTVLLMDLNIPGLNPVETYKLVRQSSPQTHVVIFTGFHDHAQMRPLLNAGVEGYLFKDELTARVVEMICQVAKGENSYSPAIVKYLSEQSRQPQTPTLTENECALLKYLVDGWTDQKIACKLNVSSRTVRNYLRQLYDKLGVDSRLEAAVKALRRGLVW